MSQTVQRKARAFSLIELVIVVVIIGIIAAIAIPRMSRGAAGAADSALSANLAVLRNAIDLYHTEHGATYPPAASIDTHLSGYSNATGSAAQAAKDATHYFGPYVRNIPPLPVGSNKTSTVIVDGSSNAVGAVAGGWWYDPATGEVKANLPDAEVDASGKKYNAY